MHSREKERRIVRNSKYIQLKRSFALKERKQQLEAKWDPERVWNSVFFFCGVEGIFKKREITYLYTHRNNSV